MILILFDVDGTLVHCGRQVRPIFSSALVEVYGTAGDIDGYDFSGKTDNQIVMDLLGACGFSEERIEQDLPRAKRIYFESLDRRLERGEMRLLPGVEAMLGRLDAQPGVKLGLLTGNWERGARIKLSRFDLNRYFPFGAFGDGQRDRRNLPPLALERAAASSGQDFQVEQTLIVGDSPLDVDCARANGIRVLAVATGWTSAEDLEAAGADRVIPDLTRTVWDRSALDIESW